MAALSSYMANKIIDHMYRNQAFTPPSTVYVALFTASTGLSTNNPSAEVSGNGYARQAIALDPASGGATANTADIEFPVATGSWGTITHVAIVDHPSNTTWGTNVNVLAYAAVSPNQAIASGNIFMLPAGNVDLSFE